MQELPENKSIRCIKGPLKEQALRVASAVNEEEFLDKLHGSRQYIEQVEKLFVSSQHDRAYRLDFANVTQKRTASIIEYYANWLYVGKAANITNLDRNEAAKDQFIK